MGNVFYFDFEIKKNGYTFLGWFIDDIKISNILDNKKIVKEIQAKIAGATHAKSGINLSPKFRSI